MGASVDYEYLRVRWPILALMSGGAGAELLEWARGIRTIPPQDTESVARLRRRQYESQRSVTLPPGGPSPEGVEGYSRERLTARLAAELDVLVTSTQRR
jgi:hypothetical protein